MEGEVKIGDTTYKLTYHAQHRALKRRISLDEIRETLLDSKHCRRAKDTSRGGYVYSITGKNHVRVILNLERTVIITVLRVSKQYSASKRKQYKNKRQLENKRLYGNRAKK